MSDPRKWSMGRRTREEQEADIAVYDVAKTLYMVFKQLKKKIPELTHSSWALADRVAKPSSEVCTVKCIANQKKKQELEENKELIDDFEAKLRLVKGIEEMGDEACKLFERIEDDLKNIYGISGQF